MRKKKLIITLTMTIALGLGVTAYASTESAKGTYQREGIGKVTAMSGYEYVEVVLKNKLGMTDKEITDGLNAGKTMYDLAKEKGMTEEQLKAAVLEEKNKAVDKAVVDGKITKEEGETLKANLKNNVDSCTDISSQRHGNGRRGKGCNGVGSHH